MLHTKFQGHQPFGSGEEDFLRFLQYMGIAATLVMSLGPFEHQSKATTLLKSSGKFHVSVIILHTQNFIKIHQFVLKILNGNKIPTSIKGHSSTEK